MTRRQVTSPQLRLTTYFAGLIARELGLPEDDRRVQAAASKCLFNITDPAVWPDMRLWLEAGGVEATASWYGVPLEQIDQGWWPG